MSILHTICGIEIIIDEDDYEYLSKYTWYRLVGRNTTYARCNLNGKTKMITHILADKYNWDVKNNVVDHINRNGLDNRKINLQVITQQENMIKDCGWKNKKYNTPKNIYYVKSSGKYKVSIYRDGTQNNLGTYPSLEVAIEKLTEYRSKFK